ncbi:MAG: prefoldin subunit alpha [Candidatus Thorarchaeota archaeon]
MTEDPRKAIEQLYSEQMRLESAIPIVQQNLKLYEGVLSNLKTGHMVLEELEGKEEGEEMLMSVGGGILVKAKLIDPVTVNRVIGKSVTIQQTREEAKKDLQEAITDYESKYETEAKRYSELVTYHNQVSTRLQQLVALVQGQEE